MPGALNHIPDSGALGPTRRAVKRGVSLTGHAHAHLRKGLSGSFALNVGEGLQLPCCRRIVKPRRVPTSHSGERVFHHHTELGVGPLHFVSPIQKPSCLREAT
jgi:hypothetical protein